MVYLVDVEVPVKCLPHTLTPHFTFYILHWTIFTFFLLFVHLTLPLCAFERCTLVSDLVSGDLMTLTVTACIGVIRVRKKG